MAMFTKTHGVMTSLLCDPIVLQVNQMLSYTHILQSKTPKLLVLTNRFIVIFSLMYPQSFH